MAAIREGGGSDKDRSRLWHRHVQLIGLAAGAAVYPNKGRRVTPRFITRVTDRHGQVLLEDLPLGPQPPPVLQPLEFAKDASKQAPSSQESDAVETALAIDDGYPDAESVPTNQIISEAAAYLMCDLLQAVVTDLGQSGNRQGNQQGGNRGDQAVHGYLLRPCSERRGTS